METQSYRDEVIYKVGRNLLRFQHMEILLKYLVSHGTISGRHNELMAKFERRKLSVSKSTLGMNVGEFLSSGKAATPPEELPGGHLKFSVEYELDQGIQSEIEDLVEERNYLAHHFLESVDSENMDSWMAASNRLDQQVEKLSSVIGYLYGLAKQLNQSRKVLADHINTKEFEEWFTEA